MTAVQHLHLHIELPREVGPRLGTGIELDGVKVRQPGGELVTRLDIPVGAYLLVGDGVALLTKDQRELIAHTASVMTGKTVRLVTMNAAEEMVASLMNPAPSFCPVEPEASPEPESEAKPEVSLAVELEPELELEPIPIAKNDFRHFGREYGYAQNRAGRVWNRVFYTAREDAECNEGGGLPAIRYVGVVGYPHPYKRDESVLDLRSVAERLAASGWRPGAWDKASKADIAFLRHLVEGWGVGS